MNFKTIIEVQEYGDFDVLYTECIMVSNEEKNVDTIVQDFFKLKNIPNTKGLRYSELYKLTKEFIVYLYSIGFTKLETKTVHFSD